MARNNIKLITPTSQRLTERWIVAAGAQGSSGGGGYRGEPFVSFLATAVQTGIVKVATDGAGVIGTTAATNGRFVGIAKSDSTQTAAAAGYVTTWLPLAGMVYESAPKTAGACNTDAEIDALRGAAVFFELSAATSGVYSVDTAATDASANALVIIGGESRRDICHFVVKPGWSVVGNISTLS
jgi:hypothetical protein